MERNVFVSLKVINGEYEYNCLSVHKVIAKKFADVERFAENHAASFYGTPDGGKNKKDEDSDFYSFFGGAIAVKVAHVDVITDEEYKVLNKFLSK